jgi:phospholipase/lecithinase/hemolysin
MATQWLRRAWLLAACASVLALGACGGGGSTESRLDPQRIVAFGDAFADLGQNGNRYTVNDDSVNNWTLFVAREYDLTLAPSSAGGLSYATGNARVAAKPDAGGNAATPTVVEQVDAFLADHSPRKDDLVIVNAGTSDVIVQAQSVITGAQTASVATERAGRAGRDLGAQVRRLVQAGASHVVVVGPYNLGVSAWADEVDQGRLMEELSRAFNDQLKVSLVNYGNSVLYVDAALHFNLVTSVPTAYEFNSDITDVVCTSVDPGPGIGTGPDQVNSNRCTPATIESGKPYNQYLFADRVYPTPRGHRLFGEYATERIRDRW